MCSQNKNFSHLKQLTLASALLFFSSQACAAETAVATPNLKSESKVVLQTSRPETFYFDASFSYWMAMQENMELGVVNNTTNPLDVASGSFVNMNFDFKPGFQLGAGVNFLPENWNLYLEYTWFRSTNTVTKTLDATNVLISLLPTWHIPTTSNPTYFFGEESWSLHMDIADAQLSKSFYVGKKLAFHPFFGLRAPWIRQNLDVNYNIDIFDPLRNTTITESTRSWGIGPRIGSCVDWFLGRGFKFYGKGGADLIFTQYTRLNFHQESDISGVVVTGTRYSFSQSNVNTVRPHMDLALGFGWGSYIAKDKAHVSLSADYGFQVFFDQNMFRTFLNDQSIAKSIAPNGNLYMQGLTVSLLFEF